MKCIVCDKEGATEMFVCDGYMDTGEFYICPEGMCHRKIVEKGVLFWNKKLEKEAK